MYIAVCDDQTEELKDLTELLGAWETDRGTPVRVPFSQLTYVEVNGKHLYFNLADGQVREVVGSMKEYEDALLTRPEFMRIHRSYIVNMLQIEELSPAGLRTFSGRELPVSRLLYPQLQKDYMKLLFAQREE